MWETVSDRDAKQHKYLVKLFQNIKYWPKFKECVDINKDRPSSKDELFNSLCAWLGSTQNKIKLEFFSVLEIQIWESKKKKENCGCKVIYFAELSLKSLRAVPTYSSDIKNADQSVYG